MKINTINILIFILGGFIFTSGYVLITQYQNTPSTETSNIWVTYTNEKYGYRVDGTEGYGRILQENLDVIEADGASGEAPGAESRIFYFKDIGIAKNQLGIISCYDERQPWPELSTEMPLEEYAQTLFDIEMSIEPSPNYDQKIIISDLDQVSLDGRIAYTYVYGRVKDDRVDIQANTIAENGDGKKCWIRHPITDYVRGYDAEMLSNRIHWFNSFTWIR
jgi:hypothetical protein